MIDAFAMFGANAIILLVMASAFSAAWMRQRDARYWQTWIFANLSIASSLACFMPSVPGSGRPPLAHILLALGFGLRWRAARQFGGRGAPWPVPVVAPIVGAAALFALLQLCGFETAYCAINAVAALQCIGIAWEFWRDRADGFKSRHGLVASYGLIGTMFALRVVQGMTLGYGMDRALPQDLLLQIHLIAAVVHTVSAGAFSLSLAFERTAAALWNAAIIDALTGLPNRRAFDARVRAMADRAPSGRRSLALIDIDHFKAINDRHGHAAGDEALRCCARTLHDSLQGSGFLARVGGEEFAVVIEGAPLAQVLSLLDGARHNVGSSPVPIGHGAITMTVSTGLYHAADGEMNFDLAMRAADASLYAAKTAGRNRVELAA